MVFCFARSSTTPVNEVMAVSRLNRFHIFHIFKKPLSWTNPYEAQDLIEATFFIHNWLFDLQEMSILDHVQLPEWMIIHGDLRDPTMMKPNRW
jgi:hypothetical protein